MAALVDTNVLVYRFDSRFPTSQPLLAPDEARREAEEILTQFVILYPNESLVRTAIRGWAAYQLGWFDAHLWACAETYGLPELFSEDFQHDRVCGTVRAIDPFR